MIAMATRNPQARQGLVLQEMGREGLLYDREGELIHILNVTALEVWKACDGARDLDAIESIMRTRFACIDGQDVRRDIEKLLMQFDERGLLAGAHA